MEISTGKASGSLAWAVYVVILFEMIYMSTPFAVFFYSVYGAPLRVLGGTESTAWLVQTILPHFAQTNSILINGLLHAAWPLMGIGLAVFLVGFGQVYWSKFRKKGPVVGGLYRYVRHPQYAGWAVFGLGMALAWSRMIVWIMYVSMLFVYYLLALREERECLRFGGTYGTYLERTGRFLPRLHQRGTGCEPFPPHGRGARAASLIALYVLATAGTIGLGFAARAYTLDRISGYYEKDLAAVSLTPLDREEIRSIVELSFQEAGAREHLGRLSEVGAKRLVYILPAEWEVPELGVEREGGKRGHGFNPTNHGNPAAFDRNRCSVLISDAVVSPEAEGKEILSKARGQAPLLLLRVDLGEGRVTGLSTQPGAGKYGDLPVPVF
jgi:protein-S-isoprenylcysteine O-methyltransferase Ste14